MKSETSRHLFEKVIATTKDWNHAFQMLAEIVNLSSRENAKFADARKVNLFCLQIVQNNM